MSLLDLRTQSQIDLLLEMISAQAYDGKPGRYFPSDCTDDPDSDLQRLLDLKLVVRLDASGSLNEEGDGECCQVTQSGLAQLTMGQRYIDPKPIFEYESKPPPLAAKMTAIDILVSFAKGWVEGDVCKCTPTSWLSTSYKGFTKYGLLSQEPQHTVSQVFAGAGRR